VALPEPTSRSGRNGLRALLDRPGEWLLGLDFDGVLAPIVADPTQSRAHPGVVPALLRLAPRLGAIAVITGRPARLAVDYAGLDGVPGLEGLVVFGHYGAERWAAADGRIVADPVPDGVAAVRQALPDLLGRLGLADVHLEDKGRSVAVHTRRAPDPVAAFESLGEPVAALAAHHGLTVEPGRFVLEVRPPGVDKGATLRRHVADLGLSAAAYVGDDLGDLAAFAAVDEIRAGGGAGLKVCAGSDEVAALAERADVVVDGPPGVVSLLDTLGDELDRRNRRDA
jgi:trehalose 6-phosphate phosphatase